MSKKFQNELDGMVRMPAPAFCFLMILMLGIQVTSAATSQWVAFNDHVPGTIGTQTSSNATIYNGLTGSGGPLKNIATGGSLPAGVAITRTGSPTGGATGGLPIAGSDAANTFNGYVYFGGTVSGTTIQTKTNDTVTYTFTNLDASRKYSFAGTAIRGSSSYPLRWSLFEILGTANGNQAFASAHTPGTSIVTNGASFNPTTVASNAVAINTGNNLEGDVARWINIQPAPDGSFSVRCTQYTGPIPAGGNAESINNGYAINGFRLEEFSSGPSVIIANPIDQQLLAAGSNILVQINAISEGAVITNISVLTNGTQMAEGAATPFTFAWSNAAAGNYSIQATASDSQGLSATSSVVTITISTNSAPPSISSQIPVPGAVSDLTSVTVLFSKPVTGIQASDLLINQSPASGMVGASNIYIFSFPRPANGTVTISWATNHQITDLFAPPHRFDETQSSATWNYTLDHTNSTYGEVGMQHHIKLVTPASYLPGIPFLVRIELRHTNEAMAWEVWDADAILSTPTPGIILSTNRVHLYNGMGSILAVATGGSDFNLSASISPLQTNRWLVSKANVSPTTVSGTLSGSNIVWSGVIKVTGDVVVPTNSTLSIEPDTWILLNGVTSGSGGTDIEIRGRIQSMGTEAQPVSFTVSTNGYTWGELRHTNNSRGEFHHTIISKGGRSPSGGHTSSGPLIRMNSCTNIYDNCSLTDVTYGENTIGKIMMTGGTCDLTFTNCLLTRALMGPEIAGTGLRCDKTYFLDMIGSPIAPQLTNDNDAIYVHDQGGRVVTLRDSVFAHTQDDGIDTLHSVIEVEHCLIRNCDNMNEDSKGLSIYGGDVRIKDSLIVDNKCGISGKDESSVVISVDHCTVISKVEWALGVFNKSGSMFPTVNVQVTNSIIRTQNPYTNALMTSYNPLDVHVYYSDIGNAWTGATNSFLNDPKFMDESSHDYRLQAFSPCIDTGDPASPLDPDGSRTDVGFYTFIPPPPSMTGTATITNGLFEFNLCSYPNRNYEIDYSTDLIAWHYHSTLFTSNAVQTFQDPVSSGWRFYRVRVATP